jgi:hypothetical protein
MVGRLRSSALRPARNLEALMRRVAATRCRPPWGPSRSHHMSGSRSVSRSYFGRSCCSRGSVNAARMADAPVVAGIQRSLRPSRIVRARGAGSFASPRRQGRRYAARCARPCRAALDRAALLRWMAMRVALTRNPPDSRHFLPTRFSPLRREKTAMVERCVRRDEAEPAVEALSHDPRKRQETHF